MLMASPRCSCALVNRNPLGENQKFFSLIFSLISKLLLTLPKFNFAIKTFWNDIIRLRTQKCVTSSSKSFIYMHKKYIYQTVAQFSSADSPAVARYSSTALLASLQWLVTG